jgi:hypothetical protein
MSLMQSAGSAEMLSFAKIIQRTTLEPILARNYRFTEQFGTTKTTVRRVGQDGQQIVVEEVGLEDILGEYQYEWRGAAAAQERSMLMGTMQQFPDLLMKLSQVDPRLMQMFDAVAFCRMMLTDGLNVPWADEVFKTPAGGVSVSPDLEHQSMEAHRRVTPHPADVDPSHLMEHVQALQTSEVFLTDPIARQLLVEHLEMTQGQMQAKAMAQQQAAMAAAQQPPPGAPGPQAPSAAPQQGPAPPAGPPPTPGNMMADQMRQMAGRMQ